jgi:hypothetical protein
MYVPKFEAVLLRREGLKIAHLKVADLSNRAR